MYCQVICTIKLKSILLFPSGSVGAYDCLVILIKRDADVNSQDKSGVTPLQLAARNGLDIFFFYFIFIICILQNMALKMLLFTKFLPPKSCRW